VTLETAQPDVPLTVLQHKEQPIDGGCGGGGDDDTSQGSPGHLQLSGGCARAPLCSATPPPAQCSYRYSSQQAESVVSRGGTQCNPEEDLGLDAVLSVVPDSFMEKHSEGDIEFKEPDDNSAVLEAVSEYPMEKKHGDDATVQTKDLSNHIIQSGHHACWDEPADDSTPVNSCQASVACTAVSEQAAHGSQNELAPPMREASTQLTPAAGARASAAHAAADVAVIASVEMGASTEASSAVASWDHYLLMDDAQLRPSAEQLDQQQLRSDDEGIADSVTCHGTHNKREQEPMGCSNSADTMQNGQSYHRSPLENVLGTSVKPVDSSQRALQHTNATQLAPEEVLAHQDLAHEQHLWGEEMLCSQTEVCNRVPEQTTNEVQIECNEDTASQDDLLGPTPTPPKLQIQQPKERDKWWLWREILGADLDIS